MLWIRKRFTRPNVWSETDLMDRAEKLILRFPWEFMMVEDEHKLFDSTIWVRLPDATLKALFPDFTEGDISDVKVRPIKLAAEDSKFDEVFGALPRRH
jgi:hypothetical protein